jgi:polyhydroxyalkanoate synthase subunit PhaC
VKKIDFYTRQFVDLTASGHLMTENPAVMHATLQSSGENLVAGLGHLLGQLERATASLSSKGTPAKPGELAQARIGVDVATTPGKVIYQNPLMQLIQYAPSSKKVHARPLLMVPPWLTKFYIFDLRPENSLVRWIVEKGYTVFVISWVNPDGALAEKGFDDYVTDGIVAALDAIEDAGGGREVNILGFGLGGTMTAAAIGYLAAIGDKRVKTATLLSTLTDFSEAGPLSVFVDEEHLGQIEKLVNPDARRSMAATFNLLRANDLIWSTVLEQYVAGARPFPFDLFLWNADATKLPRALHRFYLERLYRENLLVKPDGISLSGVPIDLTEVAIPIYLQASRDDNIAPWRTVYGATGLFAGKTRFVLSGSGHHGGVLAPPSDGAAVGYAVGDQPIERDDELGANTWLQQATWHEGSWWPDWEAWLAKQSGSWVKPRRPGGGKLKALEDAPGSYVRAEAGD